MSDFTHILWLDLETTGLDPETGEILEIGAVLTERDLTISDEFDALVRPKTLDFLALHPTVRAMHEANGLFQAIFDGIDYDTQHSHEYRHREEHRVSSISWRDQDIDYWLGKLVGRDKRGLIALGGSGVSHFDVRWINKHMPLLAGWLYRSTVDIGVIRRFIENVADLPDLVPAEHRDLNHRALDDAYNHLGEALHYREFFRKWGAFSNIMQALPRVPLPTRQRFLGAVAEHGIPSDIDNAR